MSWPTSRLLTLLCSCIIRIIRIIRCKSLHFITYSTHASHGAPEQGTSISSGATQEEEAETACDIALLVCRPQRSMRVQASPLKRSHSTYPFNLCSSCLGRVFSLATSDCMENACWIWCMALLQLLVLHFESFQYAGPSIFPNALTVLHQSPIRTGLCPQPLEVINLVEHVFPFSPFRGFVENFWNTAKFDV